MITLQGLKIFADLAQEKSFVKTAYMNYLTQPSISAHLKQLEHALGMRLLDRAPRKVSLTKDGEFLLPYVREILVKSDNLKNLASQHKKLTKGQVHVTTIYSIGIYQLAPILKEFMRTWPDIHVLLQYRRSDVIYDLIATGQTDIGLVAYPKIHPKVEARTFATDRMVLIAPPNHRLAKKRTLALKDIDREDFVAFDPGIPTQGVINDLLKEKGIHVNIRATNENVDTLKKAVEVGLGISIVPYKTAEEEAQKKTLVRIPFRDVTLERPLAILTHQDKALSHPSQLFIKMLTAHHPTGKKASSRSALAKP